MNLLRAIIIEDEELNRQRLHELVKNHCPTVEVAALACDGFEGIKVIRELKPDFIFLDIQMPRINGFQMLEMYGEFDFEVVFVTAFDHYAIKAIKFSAFDFLLKPVDTDELKATVERLQKRKSKSNMLEKNRQLLQNLQTPEKAISRITLNTNDGIHIIPLNQIIYLEADGQYTHFYLKDGGKKLSSLNLREYEELLEEPAFFRAHRSFIINMNEIKIYHRGEHGKVIMSNGEEIDISKRRRTEFINLLKNS